VFNVCIYSGALQVVFIRLESKVCVVTVSVREINDIYLY
jgi:hypothetical protein